MDMRPSLIGYLREGWSINVSLAIDFTLSNLEITFQNLIGLRVGRHSPPADGPEL